ncbi:hypothetical protein A8709_07070 [Paenibacillus pectinilyticus]|uniref:Uncharacterized protein n=1 Tax=Paenibacillus pectinilyticus TaxID=512399 RepID=A0A1C0ZTK9_9BACL|nr:hypothetical protein [Paenibacillus pectinilyticus]OCT11424.1 hypothetical protein A8709_07070 [Paenibacillus pectinilyticus]
MSFIVLERFIEDGSYHKLKYTTKILDNIKDLIRHDLNSRGIRHETWDEFGVVGKFKMVNRYKYDYQSLNEYLFDLGILPLVASIKQAILTETEIKTLKDSNSNKQDFSLQFFTKNIGNPIIIKGNALNNEMTLSEQVYLWKENSQLKNVLNKRWDKILDELTDWLKKQGVKDIKFKYGSLALKEKVYSSPLEVFNLLGKEVIIRSSIPELDRVEEFAARGFLNISELKEYRQIIGVKEQFILMEVDKEEKCRKWLDRRREKLSGLSMSQDFNF